MRTLKRPMFKIGGKAEAGNDGIMSGLVDRGQYANSNAADLFKSIGTPDRLEGLSYIPKVKTEQEILQEKINAYTPKIDPSEVENFLIGDIDLSTGLPKQKPFPETPGLSFPKDAVAMGVATDVDTSVSNEKDGDTSKIGSKDTGSNVVTQAEKNELLKARAKEFEELLNPGARKRVINNALAAASAEFGKSTGNTMSDIANAITAAAGATGKMDETKQKAAELAIGESIQKGIYASKPKTKNAVETMMELIAKGKRSEDNPEGRTDDEEAYFQANIKGKSSEDRFLGIEADLGRSRAVADKYKDDKNFAGVLPFNKKDQKEFINNAPLGSVVYMNPPKDSLYEIIEKDGKKELQFLGKEKG
jgi:hypothetical protein